MEISYACLVGQMNNYFAQFPYAIPDVTETEIAQLRILVNVGSDGLDRNVINVFVYLGVLMEVAYIHLSVLAMKVMRACFVINPFVAKLANTEIVTFLVNAIAIPDGLDLTVISVSHYQVAQNMDSVQNPCNAFVTKDGKDLFVITLFVPRVVILLQVGV